jgi:hypothetical protein
VNRKGKISYVIMLLLVFAFGNAHAQNDFRPGYILTNEGDTLSGFIDLQIDVKNCAECIFKKKLDSDIEKFNPFEIRAYRYLDGRYYISHEIKFDSTTLNVFLEVLVDGITNLYAYKSLKDEYYFIEKDGNKCDLLYRKEIQFADENDVTRVRYFDQYKGMLAYTFRDDPAIMEDLQKLNFNQSSLIKITQEYHNHVCPDQECFVYAKETRSSIYLGIDLGYRYLNMGLETSPDHAVNYKTLIGFHLRFIPSLLYHRLNLIAGITFSKIDFSNTFRNRLINSNYTSTNQFVVISRLINLPLHAEYSVGSKKVRPFFALGIDNCIFVNSITAIYPVTNGVPAAYKIESPFRKYNLGVLVGTGLNLIVNDNMRLYSKCEYGYQKPLANFNYAFDYLHINSIKLVVGLEFLLKSKSV